MQKSEDSVVLWGSGVTEVTPFETELPTIAWIGIEQQEDGRSFAIFNVRDYEGTVLLAIECESDTPEVRVDWHRRGNLVVYVADEKSTEK